MHTIHSITTADPFTLSAPDLRGVAVLWTAGLSCPSCELYYPASHLVNDCCPIHCTPVEHLPAPSFEAARLTIEGSAQICEVLIDRTAGRAGVAWGGNATWIDLRAGEGAEDAARIVLNDAEETERRA